MRKIYDMYAQYVQSVRAKLVWFTHEWDILSGKNAKSRARFREPGTFLWFSIGS